MGGLERMRRNFIVALKARDAELRFDDAGDYAHEVVHGGAGEHGEEAVLDRDAEATPGIVDEYVNGSTGNGDEGDSDMSRRSMVARELSVGDVNGKIAGEDRGKQDAAQKATASAADEAIGKKDSGKTKATSGKGKHTA
jgi:hypothetical protein